MKINLKEIGQELKSVLTGKTLDALILPLVFALTNAAFGLTVGAIATLGLSLILVIYRLFRKQPWSYTLAGVFLVAVAIGLTLLTQDALNYFIPALITNALLVLTSLISLLIGKPLAAWASHLTRGWPLAWFWRKDILPAYREVTIAWAVFFLSRLLLQLTLFFRGQIGALAWMESLLGWPITLLILVGSYVYGVWRLRQLGGPGVDEFNAGTEPPWKGQTRGF
ncbi:MAG: DUF3159 domain-containing protein [Anaerolineaceae bacterium]|nr:DUF3159 domain-containing protein [Anaerolineaceae bacterium]